jgi:hypothetical protein
LFPQIGSGFGLHHGPIGHRSREALLHGAVDHIVELHLLGGPLGLAHLAVGDDLALSGREPFIQAMIFAR